MDDKHKKFRVAPSSVKRPPTLTASALAKRIRAKMKAKKKAAREAREARE